MYSKKYVVSRIDDEDVLQLLLNRLHTERRRRRRLEEQNSPPPPLSRQQRSRRLLLVNNNTRDGGGRINLSLSLSLSLSHPILLSLSLFARRVLYISESTSGALQIQNTFRPFFLCLGFIRWYIEGEKKRDFFCVSFSSRVFFVCGSELLYSPYFSAY